MHMRTSLKWFGTLFIHFPYQKSKDAVFFLSFNIVSFHKFFEKTHAHFKFELTTPIMKDDCTMAPFMTILMSDSNTILPGVPTSFNSFQLTNRFKEWSNTKLATFGNCLQVINHLKGSIWHTKGTMIVTRNDTSKVILESMLLLGQQTYIQTLA